MKLHKLELKNLHMSLASRKQARLRLSEPGQMPTLLGEKFGLLEFSTYIRRSPPGPLQTQSPQGHSLPDGEGSDQLALNLKRAYLLLQLPSMRLLLFEILIAYHSPEIT